MRCHPEALFGVMFRILWSYYGMMFTNGCQTLQHAISLLGIRWQVRLNGGSPADITYFREQLSVFHNGLGFALHRMSINESHLFALFYVLIGFHGLHLPDEDPDDIGTKAVYIDGFLRVMKYLSTSAISSGSSILYSLWPWMLSPIITILSTFPRTLDMNVVDMFWSTHTLMRELNLSLENSLPNSLHRYRFGFQLQDIALSLKACLRVFLTIGPPGCKLAEQRKREVEESLRFLNNQIKRLLNTQEAARFILIMVWIVKITSKSQHNLVAAKFAMKEFGASYLEFRTTYLARILLSRAVLEKIMFNSTTTDPRDMAIFLCQFLRSAEYIKTRSRFFVILFLAASFLSPIGCLEGMHN